MNPLIKSCIPVALAFIIGLGLPKTFTILYIILLITYYTCLTNGSWKFTRPLAISTFTLFLFGISYSVIQIWHSVWTPWSSYLPEIVAVSILPAACLNAGWLVGTQPSSKSTVSLNAYIVGCLIYSLLCILRSHQPWWNLMQTIQHVALVPWGDPQWLSIRAIEQRGFLSFAYLASVATLFQIDRAKKNSIIICCILGLIGLYITYSTQSRIGLFTLYLMLIPNLYLQSSRFLKLAALAAAIVPLIAGLLSGLICDERIGLVINFVREMPKGLMGGRVITFPYKSCISYERLSFGSNINTDAFTPHNVILDVYNDAGIIPFSLLLVAVIILSIMWINSFSKCLRSEGLSFELSMRWAIFCVLFVQWVAQPFMYTDQLMFSLGFWFLGLTLREFNSCQKRSVELNMS